MIIRELDYERSTAPLVPIKARVLFDPYALDLLFVAVRLLICLAAIWMGIQISLYAPNDGVAAIAALACGGVIYGLLGRTRE